MSVVNSGVLIFALWARRSMAPRRMIWKVPGVCRPLMSVMRRLMLIRSSKVFSPSPPRDGCPYKVALGSCAGMWDLFLSRVVSLAWSWSIWAMPRAAWVVGYRICGYITVCIARLVPPAVRLRERKAFMFFSVLERIFSWCDPSNMQVILIGF